MLPVLPLLPMLPPLAWPLLLPSLPLLLLLRRSRLPLLWRVAACMVPMRLSLVPPSADPPLLLELLTASVPITRHSTESPGGSSSELLA